MLIIKPTRCTNFSNLFLEWNSTCFRQFLCPSSGVFHCTHSNGICYTGLLCVQWKTPDNGQRNCPKHVEFHSKDKFQKLVHLVGFIIRIYHDARSPERQIHPESFLLYYVSSYFQLPRCFKIRSLQRASLNYLRIDQPVASLDVLMWPFIVLILSIFVLW